MRITGGKYRSRLIKCPPGEIRPAMDRMRTSLFSILGNDLTGLSFLDLFSGSGCMAIEAASRGASRVVLVEKDFRKKQTILENLKIVEQENRLFLMDVKDYITRFSGKENFDIAYLDPPFPMQGKVDVINALALSNIVKTGGIIIIHYPAEEGGNFDKICAELEEIDFRKYGRSNLKFFKFKG